MVASWKMFSNLDAAFYFYQHHRTCSCFLMIKPNTQLTHLTDMRLTSHENHLVGHRMSSRSVNYDREHMADQKMITWSFLKTLAFENPAEQCGPAKGDLIRKCSQGSFLSKELDSVEFVQCFSSMVFVHPSSFTLRKTYESKRQSPKTRTWFLNLCLNPTQTLGYWWVPACSNGLHRVSTL